VADWTALSEETLRSILKANKEPFDGLPKEELLELLFRALVRIFSPRFEKKKIRWLPLALVTFPKRPEIF